MSITRNSFRRSAAWLAATAFTVGAVLPALSPHTALAAQVQDRSITMSNATPAATAVTYKVSFEVQTAGVIEAVNVDFCGGASDTPIISDPNCSLPSGMSLGGVGFANIVGLDTTNGTWAVDVINSSHTVRLYNAGATASIAANTVVTFELTGITNPNNAATAATFYGRILTYGDDTVAASYTSSAPGAYVDYGGIALSTSTPIQVTAKVMESLTFCVSDSTITDCTSGLVAPSVNLGSAVGSNFVLKPDAVYGDGVFTQLSTNALHGAIVSVKTTSSATCAGLSSDNGATCTSIPAVASGATTPTAITAGTAAFGMCVVAGGSTTVNAPYNGSNCAAANGTTLWGMDDSSATEATSTYGSPLFHTTAAVNQGNNGLKYGATASLTTPAGIYTTTQSLIATSTF